MLHQEDEKMLERLLYIDVVLNHHSDLFLRDLRVIVDLLNLPSDTASLNKIIDSERCCTYKEEQSGAKCL
jgi:hypothetical protein